MKKLFALIILIFTLISCSSKKEIAEKKYQQSNYDGMIAMFKIQAFCACYKYSFKENDIIKLMAKEDLMGSYDGLANERNVLLIDSLGKSEADKIKPEEYADFEGKKRITLRCLEFYTSKRLDSLARAKFKFVKDDKLVFSE